MYDLSHVSVRFVRSMEDLLEFIRWVGQEREVLAIDTETGGLVWYREPLRLVQLGDLNAAWCFDATRWMGVVKDILERYTGEFVFHNAKFDIHFLKEAGVVWSPHMWSRTHDTAVLAHLLDPVSSRALKSLATRHVHHGAGFASKQLDVAMSTQKWDWGTVPVDFDLYWGYGGLDTILTAYVFKELMPLVAASCGELYELERKTLWTTYKMETRGAFVDVNFCKTKQAQLELYVEEVRRWALDTYGLGSITSNTACVKVLQHLGVELTKLTKSGANYALDEEVLLQIDHPLAEQLLSARKAMKISTTYLENFVEMQRHGLLHADINTLGARTGRMSITRPALQTLTRGKGPVRDAFHSRYGLEEGRLITVDYDQIEMRLYAILSEDPQLQLDLMDGDFFTTLTRRTYRDDTIDKKDIRRQWTKNARYARNYGASTRKIALTNGIDFEEAERIESGWTEAYPRAAAFAALVEIQAREKLKDEGVAYVRTPAGRLQPSKGHEYYQLVNYLIQGMAADVFKAALVRADAAGLDEYMILPVHDETVLDVPLEDAEEVARIAQSVLKDESMSIPLTTGVDIVQRWGDKYA